MSRFVTLMLAFLAIILLLSATFSGVAAFFIGSRVLAEANNRVESDLNSAEEMYGAYSARLYDLLRLSADRFYLREALLEGQAGDFEQPHGLGVFHVDHPAITFGGQVAFQEGRFGVAKLPEAFLQAGRLRNSEQRLEPSKHDRVLSG